MPTELLWVIPLGLIVGVALGSLGGGGSIMTVPALVYLLGQDARAATTGSLIIVGLTSLIGAIPHYRDGHVKLGRGVTFGVLGVVGSYLGSRLAAGLASNVLLASFAVLMFVVAGLMVRRIVATSKKPDAPAAPPQWGRVVIAATAVGLLTGFFGVGGGFAVVPAMVLVLGLPMRAAVGTSLIVIAINSATALASRVSGGVHLDWPVIGGFALFAVAGSLFGARVSRLVSPRTLSIAFAALLFAVAVYMAVQSFPTLGR